jgi:hypothetical protein
MSELVALAAEIRREVEEAERAWHDAVSHAIRAGELLLEAKGQVKHGQWLLWLKANFPGSARSAQGYMRLARHVEDAQALAHLGVEGALRQLAAPREAGSNGDGDLPPPFAELADSWYSLTERQRLHLHNLAQNIEARAEELEHRARSETDLGALLEAEADMVRADGKCEVFAHAVLYHLEQAPEGEEASRLRGRAYKVLADVVWAAA